MICFDDLFKQNCKYNYKNTTKSIKDYFCISNMK